MCNCKKDIQSAEEMRIHIRNVCTSNPNRKMVHNQVSTEIPAQNNKSVQKVPTVAIVPKDVPKLPKISKVPKIPKDQKVPEVPQVPKVDTLAKIDSDSSINKASILKDIYVYVDVHAKNENHSEFVANKVLALGANVVKSLGKRCSHMVFKDGNLPNYKKAKNLGIFIVSCNWVDACENENKLVDESLYPTLNMENYEKEALI